MARVILKDNIAPTTIDKFLGLNLKGDMQLRLGESSNMTNCYITNDYKLNKMFGYRLFTDIFPNLTTQIQGMWYGKLGSTYHFVVATNGHIYKMDGSGAMNYNDVSTWISQGLLTPYTDLGTVTDAPTKFFEFNGVLYMLNGSEYMKWTGTGNFTTVDGYIPKIRISCTPSTGSGTEYEKINLLTGKKHLTYNGNGTTTVYQLPETSLTSVDSVYVNGVLQTLTTHYSVNLTNGTVTFVTAPGTGLDNVDIYYTKGTGNRSEITGHKGAILFGVDNDTRVFLFGHSTYKNRVNYSDLANGIPSVEYFPATFYNDIGTSNEAITDINKQYDRMIIFKENQTYYSTYNTYTLEDLQVVNFPVAELNKTTGNKAFGQTQLLDNSPYSIDGGIVRWTSTTVRDERNAKGISDRIEKDLKALNLSKAITVDWSKRNEYWLAIDKDIYIYNYQADTFSKLEIKNNVKCFLIIEDELWMGSDSNDLYKFSEDFASYNERYNLEKWTGSPIEMYFETGFYDFKAPYLRKNMHNIWLSIKPQIKTSGTVGFITDREENGGISIKFEATLFNDIDFNDFTFEVPTNVKPYKLKLKAKKFTYLKIKITNTSPIETLQVLAIIMKTEYSGESK